MDKLAGALGALTLLALAVVIWDILARVTELEREAWARDKWIAGHIEVPHPDVPEVDAALARKVRLGVVPNA